MLCWKSFMVFLVKNEHAILSPNLLIFLSTCFLSISTGFVFIFVLIDWMPHWSELMHLSFWAKKSIICRSFWQYSFKNWVLRSKRNTKPVLMEINQLIDSWWNSKVFFVVVVIPYYTLCEQSNVNCLWNSFQGQNDWNTTWGLKNIEKILKLHSKS